MSSFKLRPRFRKICKGTIDEHKEHFRELLEKDADIDGTIASSLIKLRIAPKNNHYWSPELTLMLEPHEKGTLIRGLYSPKSSVWTLFAFAYGTISILLAGILIWGGVEWQMNNDTSLLAMGVPSLLGAGLLVYLIAQFGQKIGAEQMFTLHHFFEDAIKERVHIE
ncbi:MAG: hypothetical protein R2863_09995 [Candidatus Kapaibacterium sp.]|nr:hypothetical protein [Ignavibacteriota bacterium]MCB9222184.1 hypothetical protein [Ignavibacteria bacterium]